MRCLYIGIFVLIFFSQAHAQDIFDKANQKAHYPLTATLHNGALSDLFLEVSHYDVSGNNRHGEFIDVNKSESSPDSLYYQASPPFYPIFSRVKQQRSATADGNAIANPGKNFTTPDNNLVSYRFPGPGLGLLTVGANITPFLWDLNGNGKRDCAIDPNTNNCKENALGDIVKEKELYVPFKAARGSGSGTTLKIPQPFNSVESNGFTVSFWYRVSECEQNLETEIMDTHFFGISMLNGAPMITTKADNKKYLMASESVSDCNSKLKNKWIFIAITYRNKDGTGAITNNLVFFRYILDVPGFANFSAKISKVNENTAVNPLSSSVATTEKATIMGPNFGGSIFSVRFIKKYIGPEKIRAIIRADVAIVRRSARTDHYLIRGVSSQNFLYSGDTDVKDRFGRPGYCIQFTPYQKFILPPFFKAGYDTKNGYSISFWTKIEQPIVNEDEIPFDKNKEAPDIRYQFFYAKNDPDILAGAQRVKDIFGVNRYYDNKKTYRRNPIFAWLWDPGSFNDKGGCATPPCESVGWYHVVLVYYPTLMNVYIFHPNQDGIYKRMLYFGAQNLAAATEWGLGNPNGSKDISKEAGAGKKIPDGQDLSSMNWKYKYAIRSAPFIDDFKTFAWPLTLNDVKTLHKIETDQKLSPAFDFPFNLKPQTQSEAPSENDGEPETED